MSGYPGNYPVRPQGYPPQGAGYPPPGTGYPGSYPGYMPQGVGYPPQGVGYPPQSAGYGLQAAGYAPQGGIRQTAPSQGVAHAMAGATPAPFPNAVPVPGPTPFPGAVNAQTRQTQVPTNPYASVPPNPTAQPPPALTRLRSTQGGLPVQPAPTPAVVQPSKVRSTQTSSPPAARPAPSDQYPNVLAWDAPLVNPPQSAPFPASTPVCPPCRYTIAEQQVRSYANLYSIIATIDVLQQAFAEGAVDEEKRDSVLKGLLTQYDTVVKSLQLNQTDVEKFCDAAELSKFYAWPVILNPPDFNRAQQQAAQTAPAQQGRGSTVAFDVSQKLIELCDMCHLEIRDVTRYSDYISELRSLFQLCGALPGDSQITNFIEKWYQYFRSLRGQEEVPLAKVKELNPEASECNIWARQWFLTMSTR